MNMRQKPLVDSVLHFATREHKRAKATQKIADGISALMALADGVPRHQVEAIDTALAITEAWVQRTDAARVEADALAASVAEGPIRRIGAVMAAAADIEARVLAAREDANEAAEMWAAALTYAMPAPSGVH